MMPCESCNLGKQIRLLLQLTKQPGRDRRRVWAVAADQRAPWVASAVAADHRSAWAARAATGYNNLSTGIADDDIRCPFASLAAYRMSLSATAAGKLDQKYFDIYTYSSSSATMVSPTYCGYRCRNRSVKNACRQR